MTQKLKSRYDAYIPIFRDYDDYRVRLFLDQLKQSVDDSASLALLPIDNRRAVNRYVPADMFFRWRKLNPAGPPGTTISNVPEHMKNAYYKYKITTVNGITDDSVHPEWFVFFVEMSLGLTHCTYNIAGPDTKGPPGGVQVPIPTKPNKNHMFNVLKSLKNAPPNSIQEFVRSFLCQIATFDANVNGVITPNQNFDINSNLLDNIVKITFRDESMIMDQLLGSYYPDPNQGHNPAFNNFAPIQNIVSRCIFNSTCDFAVAGGGGPLPDSLNVVSPYWSSIDDVSVLNILQTYYTTPPVLKLLDAATGQQLIASIEAMKIKEFSFNIDKFLISRLLDQELNKPKPIKSNFFDINEPGMQKYFRDKNGSLYKLRSDGSHEPVDIQAVSKLTEQKKCYGTGVTEAPDPDNPAKKLTCTNYFRDCLLGKNIDACKVYLRQNDFWKDAKEEVESMLPHIAIDTLKAFEFDFYLDNTDGQQLKKIQSVEDWLQKLASTIGTPKLTQAEFNAIINNHKLKAYLEHLVKKMNDNPSILNPNYKIGPSVPQNGPFYNRLTQMGIKPYQSPTHFPISILERLRNSVNTSSNKLLLRMQWPFAFTSRGILVGGNVLTEYYEDKLEHEHLQIASIIKMHYGALIARLKNYNKSIDPDHQQKIFNLMEKLGSIEKKLYQTIVYTDKYADLLELLGDNSQNEEVINMDSLKEFVDLRNNTLTKTTKRQLDLIDILQSIAEQQNKLEDSTLRETFKLKDVKI